MARPPSYLWATRHPWPCFFFVFPMLIAYEAGVLLLGGSQPEALRNGADHWLRLGLAALGLPFFWVPPLLLTLVFVGWILHRRGDQPWDLAGILSGMVLESVVFALGLWGISRGLAPLLQRLGVDLALPLPVQLAGPPAERLAAGEGGFRQAVTYLGAGIYEEAIFRLLLFSALVGLCRAVELPRLVAVALAAAGSAAVFSAAHHVGPYGQPYSNYLFLFRLTAGVYFALLYQLRGIGIAVGAHACYNVMVSVT
jgi:hypothetical protein